METEKSRSETAKHTRGPWRANGCELTGDSTILATLCWHSGRDVENKADARLIAAAPDMFSALIQARGALLLDTTIDARGEPYGTTAIALEVINEAIAKAGGT